jgi:hypothetical protein
MSGEKADSGYTTLPLLPFTFALISIAVQRPRFGIKLKREKDDWPPRLSKTRHRGFLDIAQRKRITRNDSSL